MVAAVYPYQGKEACIVAALREQGWTVVPFGEPADVALVERDMNYLLDHAHLYLRIVLFPHGGNPTAVCMWDGPYEPYPVDALLVHAWGHAEVLRRYGYPHPVRVIGWSYCEQRPFAPTSGDRVLFAPKHGPHSDDDSAAATDAAHVLHALGVDCTMTTGMRTPAECVALIDEADVVVAEGTFLALAVARGKPAVCYEPDGVPTAEHMPLEHVDEYRDLVRYPWRLADIDLACGYEAGGWRSAFIGEQLDPIRLDAVLREIACTPR